MRLLRLSLQNWRGVEARDTEFAEGITLIEGSNEIGKSTIVEALQTLFKELDSSNRRSVKAIQPVGEDVGSRVEAEVRAGGYHFIYAKTYNKTKQTSLDILAPGNRQLTGREAHEAVERMLSETVDMALWNALLVDQGEKVGLVSLQDSDGLAKALDEAAGNTAESGAARPGEEGSLYAGVQTVYEKYFTPRTGQPKYSNLEEAHTEAESSLVDAQAALAEVEDNASLHGGRSAEVRRLKTALPDLEASLMTHEERWQTARTLAEQVNAKEKELESAQTIRLEAEHALKTRQEQVAKIAESEKRFVAAKEKQAPLSAKTQSLKDAIEKAKLTVTELKAKRGTTRQALKLAEDDDMHLANLDELVKGNTRLEKLGVITEELRTHLQTRSSIKVNKAALTQFRKADSKLSIVRNKRDAAATTISVTARKDLMVEFDGDTVSLDESETETRAVASDLNLLLPGVASISVKPSLSVAELAGETEEAEAVMASLITQFGVGNLEEAVAANQRREDAQREIDHLKTREHEILQSANREEIRQSVATLQGHCDRYAAQRETSIEPPESVLAAGNRVADASAEHAHAESALDEAQEAVETLSKEHAELDESYRTAQQELAGIEAALKDRRMSLERDRAERSDQALDERLTQTGESAAALVRSVVGHKTALAEASPEVAKGRLENARAVLERAKSDLTNSETNLAVLTDRLEQARANGRFEEMEATERTCEETRATLESACRRADAARLLWTTLNKHRDAAREAYVRPLKDAIERLGAITFGGRFEVTIGDDWSIVSRTLDGKTLAFEDLSVGAKEQLGILARLAAAQIVSKQGGVPLIIDDALGFSDPSRLETMGAAIAAAGRESQIIILTCTPGRFMHVGSAKVVKFGSD